MTDQEQQNEVDTRFRVYGREDCIEVHGAISETSDFKPILEMIKDENVFDCKGIVSASWLGLIGLDRFLMDVNKKISLINMPHHIYKYFRLLPDVHTKYEFQSLEIPTFSREDGQDLEAYQCQNVPMQRDQHIVEIKDGVLVDGFLTHWIPMMFPDAKETPKFINSWYEDYAGETYFWINLLNFWESTLGLCQDMVSSQRIGLLQVLNRILTRVKCAEAGFSLLGKVSYQMSANFEEILLWIDQQCSDVESEIKCSVSFCQVARRDMSQGGDQDHKDDDQKIFFEHLESSAASILKISDYLSKIEKVSHEAGDRVLKTGIVRQLKEALMKIDGSVLEQDVIDQVRENFNILDPFSDGSWEETKEDISQELEAIQYDLGNCIILFQGFDLLRQVLEHRVTEAHIVVDEIEEIKKQDAWLSFQEKLFEQINKTLVTDQEKYAFYFFLPEGKNEKKSESQSPGDVLLF